MIKASLCSRDLLSAHYFKSTTTMLSYAVSHCIPSNQPSYLIIQTTKNKPPKTQTCLNLFDPHNIKRISSLSKTS